MRLIDFKISNEFILKILIFALYLERELASRNLSYWINNHSNTFAENLYLFTKPYLLVILTLFLVLKKSKLTIVGIAIGVLDLLKDSYHFISLEFWQIKHQPNHTLFTDYDSHEIRFIYTLIVKVIFYLIAYKLYRNSIRIKSA
jgi:hypothetical protein